MEQPIQTFVQPPVPSWLKPRPIQLGRTVPPLPSWLTAPEPLVATKPSRDERELNRLQFEAAFPWVLEQICEGKASIQDALAEYPVPLNLGAFTSWLYKDGERKALYEEAKIVRSEYWTGLMVKHALGEETMVTLDRSKTIINTLQWLVSRHARKEYGDTKTIEMNTTINLRAAMEQGQARVIDIKAMYDDDETPMRMLSAPVDDDEDDE